MFPFKIVKMSNKILLLILTISKGNVPVKDIEKTGWGSPASRFPGPPPAASQVPPQPLPRGAFLVFFGGRNKVLLDTLKNLHFWFEKRFILLKIYNFEMQEY